MYSQSWFYHKLLDTVYKLNLLDASAIETDLFGLLTCIIIFIFAQKIAEQWSSQLRHVHCSPELRSQRVGGDELHKGGPVFPVEVDSVPQLGSEEGFEEGEHHVEDIGLVDYVDALQTKRNALLEIQFIINRATFNFSISFPSTLPLLSKNTNQGYHGLTGSRRTARTVGTLIHVTKKPKIAEEINGQKCGVGVSVFLKYTQIFHTFLWNEQNIFKLEFISWKIKFNYLACLHWGGL